MTSAWGATYRTMVRAEAAKRVVAQRRLATAAEIAWAREVREATENLVRLKRECLERELRRRVMV